MRHGYRADAHAVDHLADIAELRAREDADVEAARGLLLHEGGELGGIARLRLALGADMGIAQDGLGLARRTPRHRGKPEQTGRKTDPVRHGVSPLFGHPAIAVSRFLVPAILPSLNSECNMQSAKRNRWDGNADK